MFHQTLLYFRVQTSHIWDSRSSIEYHLVITWRPLLLTPSTGAVLGEVGRTPSSCLHFRDKQKSVKNIYFGLLRLKQKTLYSFPNMFKFQYRYSFELVLGLNLWKTSSKRAVKINSLVKRRKKVPLKLKSKLTKKCLHI